MDDPVTKITETLRRIQEEGGKGNFVILIANAEKNYYIQVIGHKDDPALFAEAVSNHFLDSMHGLDQRHINRLEELGWNSPSSIPNFHREWNARDDQERISIANEILETFIEVYGWKPDQGIHIDIALG